MKIKITSNFTFKEMTSEQVEKKKRQYRAVALHIQDVLQRLELGESEATFEIVKKIIANNENSGIHVLLIALTDMSRVFIKKWLPIIVSFLSGILCNMLSDGNYNWDVILEIASITIVFWAFGFGMDICFSGNKGETRYKLCILKEMTYEQYKVLIKANRKENCLLEEIDRTKITQI